VRSSESLDALAAALCAAQGEFEAVAKSADNPFFRSKYAALPDVVKTATPILKANGLAVSQLIGHDEGGDTLTTCLMHSSGQFIADTMRMRPVKQDPQAQGSAVTYGRRYGYMAILGLVADEDDDGNAASAAKPKAATRGASKPAAKADPPADAVTDETLGFLRDAYKAAGAKPADLKRLVVEAGAAEGTASDALTEAQATFIVLALKGMAKEKSDG